MNFLTGLLVFVLVSVILAIIYVLIYLYDENNGEISAPIILIMLIAIIFATFVTDPGLFGYKVMDKNEIINEVN